MVKITQVTKKKNKYILDTSKGCFEVFEDVLVKYMILGEKEIKNEEFEELLAYSKFVDTYNLALNYLKKPRTIKEMKNYLYSINSYDEKIISTLLEKGYLNDEQYKIIYVDYQARINLKGPKLIKRELEEKGIYSDFEYPYEKQNIEKLTKKYLQTNKSKSSRSLNIGLYKYLQAKGYDAEMTNYINDDESLIVKDIEKLKTKYKSLDAAKRKTKIYSSLITKGYNSDLIKKYLGKE